MLEIKNIKSNLATFQMILINTFTGLQVLVSEGFSVLGFAYLF